GSTNVQLHGDINYNGRWVVCHGCSCTMCEVDVFNDEQAIARWNRRTAIPAECWREAIALALDGPARELNDADVDAVEQAAREAWAKRLVAAELANGNQKA